VVISPELALALECCRWNFPASPRRPLRVPNELDWPRFVRLARFHGIQGLAWAVLAGEELPQSAAVPLSADAKSIAAVNLKAAAECAALNSDFKAAGIPLLFVKGLTLGALAYGNALIKSAADIDVLVDEHEANRASQLLIRRGYGLAIPEGRVGEQALRSWHRANKESVWVQAESGLGLDLHTRLVDNPRLLPELGIASPTQTIEVVPTIALPTLAMDELFAYLAVHGASSAWFRLKWISDFAALLESVPDRNVERLYDQSQRLGAGRAAAQALLLADELFGSLSDSQSLRAKLRDDRSSRLLCRAALDQLIGKSEPAEPTSTPFGTARIHWTQFLLSRRAGFKVSEFVRQVRKVFG
jgi:hypothetical protein